MAFLLHNLPPSLLPYSSKFKHKHSLHQSLSPSKPSSSSSSSSSSALFSALSSSPLFTLQNPNSQVDTPPSSSQDETHQKDDFFLNLGLAVRTLREDLPLLFIKDLNFHIYRDDITFMDPLNTFTGIEKYKLIFWALRFHGKMLFREIALDVCRIWQPSENEILIRWNLRGIPRIPWEAKGEFQGTSRYKLDRNGKIYEHKVDNLAFNFPRSVKPISVLDLVFACPASPNPTFLTTPVNGFSSWIELYRVVRETLHHGEETLLPQDGLSTCS